MRFLAPIARGPIDEHRAGRRAGLQRRRLRGVPRAGADDRTERQSALRPQDRAAVLGSAAARHRHGRRHPAGARRAPTRSARRRCGGCGSGGRSCTTAAPSRSKTRSSGTSDEAELAQRGFAAAVDGRSQRVCWRSSIALARALARRPGRSRYINLPSGPRSRLRSSGVRPNFAADLADRFFELHQRDADRFDFLRASASSAPCAESPDAPSASAGTRRSSARAARPTAAHRRSRVPAHRRGARFALESPRRVSARSSRGGHRRGGDGLRAARSGGCA